MTLLRPTIIISELAVLKDNRVVLNTKFHRGLNIVSGHNSSGKTTTLDFIAHTLGAEDIPWKKEALLCDYSIVEVLLNDVPVTLRREVSDGAMRPLYIFWGPFAAALDAPVTAWEMYPFKRSQNKLSFTQSLLLSLDMPEAQGDGASNLTMHQFLRVIYADQPSLHSSIFRIDSFESSLTRATVGDYLSGVYDDRLYSAQLKKRELEKILTSAESELRSIFSVLAKSQQDFHLEFFGQQINEAERRREALLAELARLRTERTVERDKKRNADESVTRAALDTAKKMLTGSLDSVARKEAELEDSRQFIAEISHRCSPGRIGNRPVDRIAMCPPRSAASMFCAGARYHAANAPSSSAALRACAASWKPLISVPASSTVQRIDSHRPPTRRIGPRCVK